MNKKINIGLIGVGPHAEENLIPAIRLNLDSTIFGVYSSKKERLHELQNKYQIKKGFTSWKDLILCRDIACVFICGSPQFHETIIIFCIQHSMPFFVEKPPLIPKYRNSILVDEITNF